MCAESAGDFDRDHIHTMTDGDIEAILELIDLIVMDVPASLGALERSIAAADCVAAARAAHAMRGALVNIGAARAGAAADHVEERARAGRLEEVRAAFPPLE